MQQESVTISMSGTKTSLTQNYFPSIQVHDDSEIALLCLQTYNSFPNINETNNKFNILVKNNVIVPDEKSLLVEIEPGCYEIEDIKNRINRVVEKNNNSLNKINEISFDLYVDSTDFRSYLKCNHDVLFNEKANLGAVLGFTQKTLSRGHSVHRSDKAVNINSINSIKVMCNIAKGSFDNGQQGHSIYEFFPNSRTGTKIVQSPTNLIYYGLNTTTIDTIQVDLVDQENRPIHNFDEKLTIVLHIKRYGS